MSLASMMLCSRRGVLFTAHWSFCHLTATDRLYVTCLENWDRWLSEYWSSNFNGIGWGTQQRSKAQYLCAAQGSAQATLVPQLNTVGECFDFTFVAVWHRLATIFWGTNYILAGFVALGATASAGDWTSLNQAQIFPQPVARLALVCASMSPSQPSCW